MNQTLLIELLTEELPPKALAKLGDAFADRHSQRPANARDLLRCRSRRHRLRHAAPAGGVNHRRARHLARQDRSAKKCCRSRWRSTRTATRPRRWPRSWPRWASPTSPISRARTRTGRQGRKLLLRLHRQGAAACHRPASRRCEETVAKLPIPKVMSYQRPRQERRRNRAFRAPGAPPDRAARRRRGAADAARPGSRPYHARPPLPVGGRTVDRHAAGLCTRLWRATAR